MQLNTLKGYLSGKRIRPGKLTEVIEDFLKTQKPDFIEKLLINLNIKTESSSNASNLKEYILDNYSNKKYSPIEYDALREIFVIIKHNEVGGNIETVRLQAFIELEKA